MKKTLYSIVRHQVFTRVSSINDMRKFHIQAFDMKGS